MALEHFGEHFSGENFRPETLEGFTFEDWLMLLELGRAQMNEAPMG